MQSLIISLLALGWILYRQLQERPVKEEMKLAIPGFLLILAILDMSAYGQQHAIIVKPIGIAFITIGFLSGGLFGWLRGVRSHIWRDKGQLMRQGNWVTVVLWLVGIIVHLGLEHATSYFDPSLSNLTDASLFVYMAITLSVQKYVIVERAKHMNLDMSKL